MRRSGLQIARIDAHLASAKGGSWLRTGAALAVCALVLGGGAVAGAWALRANAVPVAAAPEIDTEMFNASVTALANLKVAQTAADAPVQPSAAARTGAQAQRAPTARETDEDIVSRADSGILGTYGDTLADQALSDAAARLTAPQQSTCLDDLVTAAAGATLYFEIAAVEISDEAALRRAKAVVDLANTCPLAKLELRGHSDSSGLASDNLALSWSRVDNVVRDLADLGADMSGTVSAGFGARMASPQAPDTPVDPKDRRVDFVVIPVVAAALTAPAVPAQATGD